MQLGKGVKLEKAEKRLKKAGELVEGEAVWFYGKCNNLRPMANEIVVTNARVLGLSNAEGYTYKAPIAEISSTEYDSAKGTVQVVTSDGQTMIFKSVPSEDTAAIEHFIDYARNNPAPSDISHAITALGTAGSSVLDTAGETPTDYKAAKKAHKEAKKTADQAMAGAEVATGIFGTKTVNIYKNCYVRVAMFTPKAPYERLVSIEASSDVAKKSGAGRGAAAVMTLGVNLASSNKRGDVYLTIVTDRTTHVLHESPPKASNLKTTKKLEAAGNAVIRANAESPIDAEASGSALTETVSSQQATEANSPKAASTSEKLRELTSMRDEGLLSADEFETLRNETLGSF